MLRYSIAIWIALLLALCLAPLEVKSSLHTFGRLHDLGHIAVFAVTGVLFAWSAKLPPFRAVALVAAGLLALFTEWLEHRFYHNPIEWKDVYLDCIGVLVASVIVLSWTAATVMRRQS